MPLSIEMKRLAESEVGLWAAETGMRLKMTGHMRDQTRSLSAEALFRRMQVKYPIEMKSYTLEDLMTSVFDDGDRINATCPGETITSDMFPGTDDETGGGDNDYDFDYGDPRNFGIDPDDD